MINYLTKLITLQFIRFFLNILFLNIFLQLIHFQIQYEKFIFLKLIF